MSVKRPAWMLVHTGAMAVFITGCLAAFVPSSVWWVLVIFAIGFTWIYAAGVSMFLLSLAFSKRFAMAWALLLVAALPIVLRCVGLHYGEALQTTKAPKHLRVMQWNCMGMPGIDSTNAYKKTERREMVAFLKTYQPDVLLLQEFSDYPAPARVMSNLSLLRDTLGYKHYVFAPYQVQQWHWGRQYDGMAIFSKLPLTQTGTYRFTERKHGERVAWADLIFQNQAIRLFTSHQQSMNLNTLKGEPLDLPYTQVEDSAVIRSGDVLRKLKYYQPFHTSQARQLKSLLQQSPHPLVLGIDMNAVPSSHIYRTISNGLTDLHRLHGWGLGKTFHNALPQLRIDYLFASPQLAAARYARMKVSFTDHFVLLADLYWRK